MFHSVNTSLQVKIMHSKPWVSVYKYHQTALCNVYLKYQKWKYTNIWNKVCENVKYPAFITRLCVMKFIFMYKAVRKM